ncbi:hypothetical protein [Streptomyces sp. SID3343]|uniref:hypothetical protein n=1 Tax=Streptomyces sp. SID3343 TaxID=2690260 RepID=UPI00136B0CC5|nr:hypothetical protein [Streptomyces sp. SID3343]MYW02660.1 hypothetical protein [Streptomyces sp. SID3343]
MHEAQTRETNRHDWQTLHTGTREAAARGLRQDLVRAGVPDSELGRRVTEAWAGSVVRAPGSVQEFRVVRVEVDAEAGSAAGSGSVATSAASTATAKLSRPDPEQALSCR